MELRVDGVSKAYGRKSVLTNISISISSGEVVGFVGPNGAGKSTTMKIILGLVHADSGIVRVGDGKYIAFRYINSKLER